MTYLLFEILGALVLACLAGFALGWGLRGLRERMKDGGDGRRDPDA